jgi:transcription elongation factor GreA
MSSDAVPMTKEGMAKLREQIQELEARRPAIKQAIADAREKGDLRENADYHAAREDLAMLDGKIAQIQGMLAHASVIDTSKAPKDTVVLGTTVTLLRKDTGKESTYTFVGAGQADPLEGRILTTSPIGQAVVGHKKGEVVTAELPVGPVEIEILEITFE